MWKERRSARMKAWRSVNPLPAAGGSLFIHFFFLCCCYRCCCCLCRCCCCCCPLLPLLCFPLIPRLSTFSHYFDRTRPILLDQVWLLILRRSIRPFKGIDLKIERIFVPSASYRPHAIRRSLVDLFFRGVGRKMVQNIMDQRHELSKFICEYSIFTIIFRFGKWQIDRYRTTTFVSFIEK